MNISFMVFVFLLSMIMHEFGHWFFFKYHKKKSVRVWYRDGAFAVGEFDKDYIGLTIDEKKRLFWYGIVIGSFPIYIMLFFNLGYVWTFAFYLIGCKSDFIQLRRLYTE